MNSCAVTQAMWVNAFSLEGREFHRGTPNVPLQNQAGAKASERSSMLVSKYRLRLMRSKAALMEIFFYEVGGFWPQRADPFFAPLAEKRHTCRRCRPDIGCPE